jgi:hypothetical protein
MLLYKVELTQCEGQILKFNEALILIKFLLHKMSGREAHHSPQSSAEVKNAWSYTSTPQYVFMACCLVKPRDNLHKISEKYSYNFSVINI